jgi:hypothetical protein
MRERQKKETKRKGMVRKQMPNAETVFLAGSFPSFTL